MGLILILRLHLLGDAVVFIQILLSVFTFLLFFVHSWSPFLFRYFVYFSFLLFLFYSYSWIFFFILFIFFSAFCAFLLSAFSSLLLFSTLLLISYLYFFDSFLLPLYKNKYNQSQMVHTCFETPFSELCSR